MRRIRMKKSRKYEQDKLQAAINASVRRALNDLAKSSGMLSVTVEALRQGLPEMAEKYRKPRKPRGYYYSRGSGGC